MATKKKEEVPVMNSNINNNTNNVNVHVKVEHPKTPRKNSAPAKAKPNWAVKAIVVGIIGLALSLLGYYIKQANGDEKHKPAIIENEAPSILPDKKP